MAFTTTREYMEAPTLQYLNAAADAVQAGLRLYLIPDEALLVNADPFVPVISVGIEPVRLPQKSHEPARESRTTPYHRRSEGGNALRFAAPEL